MKQLLALREQSRSWASHLHGWYPMHPYRKVGGRRMVWQAVCWRVDRDSYHEVHDYIQSETENVVAEALL